MAIILLEGLDGTGKTALADSLSNSRGWPVVNIFENKNDDFLEKIEIKKESYHEDIYFMDIWKRIGKPTVIKDRGILSGVAYNNDIYKYEALEYWMNEYKKDEMKIIILEASNETIIKRDEKWKNKKDELNKIRAKYEILSILLKEWDFDVGHFNSEKLNKKELYREVEEWLNFHL